MQNLIEKQMKDELECYTFEKAHENCEKVLKFQKDMKKEVPLTKGILTFRRDFGNG
jgi:hypothetical protein